VYLEALARGGAQVALPVVARQVVDEPVQVRGQRAGRLLQAQHELVRLALDLAVLLHVRAVVLQDLHAVLGHEHLVGVGHVWGGEGGG
jgi:hypothetical protein